MRATIITTLVLAFAAGPALAQVSPGTVAAFPTCLAGLKTDAVDRMTAGLYLSRKALD